MSKIFLQGENIFFRPYQPDDAALLYRWLNCAGQKSLTQEQVKGSIEKEAQSDRNVILVVADKNNVIGLIGLYGIDYIARKAEMRIILGDKSHRSKGYGAEIIELITYYGFDRLNLNRIYLDCPDDEKKLSRVYEKAGYTYEGILREGIFRDGQYYNLIRMAILRKDYLEKFYKSHSERFKQ